MMSSPCNVVFICRAQHIILFSHTVISQGLAGLSIKFIFFCLSALSFLLLMRLLIVLIIQWSQVAFSNARLEFCLIALVEQRNRDLPGEFFKSFWFSLESAHHVANYIFVQNNVIFHFPQRTLKSLLFPCCAPLTVAEVCEWLFLLLMKMLWILYGIYRKKVSGFLLLPSIKTPNIPGSDFRCVQNHNLQ